MSGRWKFYLVGVTCSSCSDWLKLLVLVVGHISCKQKFHILQLIAPRPILEWCWPHCLGLEILSVVLGIEKCGQHSCFHVPHISQKFFPFFGLYLLYVAFENRISMFFNAAPKNKWHHSQFWIV